MSDSPQHPNESQVDEILSHLKSELNDLKTRYYKREIPDVMTFSDLQDLAVTEAKASIEKLLTQERLRGGIEVLMSLDLRRRYGKDYQDSLDAADDDKDLILSRLTQQLKELEQENTGGNNTLEHNQTDS